MASVGPGILLPILSPQSCVMDAALLAAAILCKGAVQAAKADPRLRDVVAAQGGEVVGATLALEGQPAVLVHQLDSFVHLWSLAPLIPVRDAFVRTRHRKRCVLAGRFAGFMRPQELWLCVIPFYVVVRYAPTRVL
jgi:hypothetical protein